MSEPLKHTQGGSNRFRFTLIERLTVITIIMILAALLLPVLSQARYTAKTVVFLQVYSFKFQVSGFILYSYFFPNQLR